MTIEFSVAGLLIPASIKIISYSLDQLKQTSSTALMIDGIQMFFCFCYVFRACIIKLKIHKKIAKMRKKPDDEDEQPAEGAAEGEEKEEVQLEEEEEDDEDEEIDGYSQSCSLTTDFLVVGAFMLKFNYSQNTNYHDIQGILNNNYLGAEEE